MVRVRLLRAWNTPAGTRHPGEVIRGPAGQAARMAQTVPPYAVLVEPIDATDAARRLAEARGLDLTRYAGLGTGKGGRIIHRDVEGWTRGRS
jgi:pyruvate/2-oxoglutarate dehydrogenase complex dihydrolipoamide acyltransferase (E2) component